MLSITLSAQKSPHGETFKANCDDCHKTDGWKVDLKNITFDHDGTKFPLVGQHTSVSCKDCHSSARFSNAPTDCNDCHTDIHEQTVGNECARCHTPSSWVVTNITQLHQLGRFPLLGAHSVADCKDCHKNLASPSSQATASRLRFEPLQVECYDCHKENYQTASQPNHIQSNYSKNCTDCHNINAFSWEGAGVNHNFFPLTGGHELSECGSCHNPGTYSGLSPSCASCHQSDYASAANPSHTSLGFSTECNDCHSLNPGWKPAEYRDHDSRSFPIYSGKHNGEWDNCSDCHKNASNYGQFTCTDCHEHSKGDMDDEHDDVSGYEYNSIACFSCHPTGDGEGSFDHSKSGFPLTGAHTNTACADCHTNGFAGTTNTCAGCHTSNYTLTTNPNHTAAGISNDCATCHTTNPGWKPATYPAHSNLEGAHVPIANDCAACHKGNYATFPANCYDCHTKDFTQSNNPSHTAAQFPTTCADCHSQTAWTPSTFNHDGQYFPIYSGKHDGEWTNCDECHTTAGNYTMFSCIDCHEHNKADTDNEHQGVNGYQYNSPACFGCHPDGTSAGFDHAAAGFPLTGGHAIPQCADCHTSGYAGTTNVCSGCHTPDYNQTTNPNHTSAGIAKECATCHTTNPGWKPATYPVHSNLTGAHIPVANDCAACHQGNYVNTTTDCFSCHTSNFNQTNNPNHISAQFPTTCADCHSQTAWSPSTFNHDGQYFPIYSGKHEGEWDACSDCHPNASNYALYTCTTACHPQNETNNEHQGVGGYQYISTACLGCHPSGSSAGAFNHNTSPFPLNGGHANADCASCHTNGYTGTSSECASCHTPDYNQTTNPNHTTTGISNSCATCHTTNPGWNPATFPTHNNYYVIAGAHVPITNQCVDCHNGNYVTTPNTCSGCHMDNYNQTTNPNHASSGFSTDCQPCHSQSAWIPSTFDHNNTYPLTGAHSVIAGNCVQCHPNGYSNTPNTCAGCHQNNYNQSVNPNHQSLGLSNNCAVCHTTNPDWQPASFPVHNNYYVIAGAHIAITNQCADCHNGNYVTTPNTCAGCHMNEYNQTNNPAHAAAQFPTSCEDCHTQTAWTPSTFDHDGQYFPIYSGQHEGEWNTCSECHPNASNYAVFTCTTSCHPQNSTNNDHNGVSGYQYLSSACLSCHPNGEGDNMINKTILRSN